MEVAKTTMEVAHNGSGKDHNGSGPQWKWKRPQWKWRRPQWKWPTMEVAKTTMEVATIMEVDMVEITMEVDIIDDLMIAVAIRPHKREREKPFRYWVVPCHVTTETAKKKPNELRKREEPWSRQYYKYR
jgi:hypothetical protein